MQDQKSQQTTAQIEVTNGKSLQLCQKLGQFEAQFPKMQSQFLKSSDKVYYLVSSKFIREWKSFIQDTSSMRVQVQGMNSDIVNPETKQLLENMVEYQNFQIVNQTIYNIFTGFPVFAELKRISYGKDQQKKVPIYTIQIEYLTLNQKDLQLFDRKIKSRASLELKKINTLSANNSVIDLIRVIENQQMINKHYKNRIWKHQKTITIDKLFTHIIDQVRPMPYDSMKIKCLGKLLSEQDEKIGDLSLENGDYFILQCQQHEKAVITSSDQGKCDCCYSYKKLKFSCGCKQVFYCSQQCMDKEKKYHLARCKLAEQEELRKPVQMIIRPGSRMGLVGLQNLGNTCFMNSCLQCLSHTLPLTKYFLQKSYVNEINQENPIGSKGKLAQAYATFIKNMWCEEQSTYRPYRLKSAISDINKMFSGYAQHDSQELFSFLVDGLHEDLNRIKKKPYVQSVDSNERSDQIVSHESWLAYIKRNQSIITDNMVGQYRSKVVCPDCKKQSITFDPFITVTLPIPEKNLTQIKLFVLFQNNESDTIRISIKYKQKRVEEIYKKISDVLGKSTDDFLCYVLTFEENIYPFDTTPKNELFFKFDSLASQLFVVQLSDQEKKLNNRIEIPCRFSKKQFSKYEAFWFKRPFYFDSQQATGLTVLKAILRYLYFDTYNYSEKRRNSQKNIHEQKNSKQNSQIKSYEQYEEYMLKNRPCQVFIRWNKKIKISYSTNYETEFQQEKCLQDDQYLKNQIDLTKLEDYEIDYRFTSSGLQDFSIHRLRNFNDKYKQSNSNQADEEQKNLSLQDCFEALQTPEQLQKGNEWYCPSCKDHKLATKQIRVYKTPEILIIHLKRFKVKGVIRRQKNEANVDFPFDLNMDRYLMNQNPINNYIPYCQSQNAYITPSYQLPLNQNPSSHYELYAVSNHYGSLGSGHYTAFAKNQEKWYSFNDSSVSAVDASRVKSSGAYILFYKRKYN